jgi:hypothetical protein
MSLQPGVDLLLTKRMDIIYAICDYFKINEKLLYTYVQIIDLNELRIP